MAWSWRRRRSRCRRRRRRNCGWSGTQQQHSTDQTKRTKKFLDTKNVEFPRNTTKMMKDTLKNWRNCGWSATQQQHSKHNKANGGIKDVKTCRIFAKNYENEELFTLKWRNTAVGVDLNNNTGSTNPERNQQQGRKIRGPS